jgi:hypothetical protein
MSMERASYVLYYYEKPLTSWEPCKDLAPTSASRSLQIILCKMLGLGWESGSVVEHLPSMCQVLCSIPSTTKNERKKRKMLG